MYLCIYKRLICVSIIKSNPQYQYSIPQHHIYSMKQAHFPETNGCVLDSGSMLMLITSLARPLGGCGKD